MATKLEELGDVFCAAGDQEVGNLLKTLRESPHRLRSLRAALLHGAGPGQSSNEFVEPSEPMKLLEKLPEEIWLGAFATASGEKLSEDQIQRVLRVVQAWASVDVKRLKADALIWAEDPSSFRRTNIRGPISHNLDLIAFYFDAFEQIENAPRLDPMRRKIILLKTFKLLQEEERSLRRRKKIQQKKGQNSSSAKPIATYRSMAIDAVAQRIWGKLPNEEYARRRKTLTRMTRHGEKWSLIRHRGLILGLGKSQLFEQRKWAPLEIMAINKYLESIPLYAIRHELEGAMQAIDQEYSYGGLQVPYQLSLDLPSSHPDGGGQSKEASNSPTYAAAGIPPVTERRSQDESANDQGCGLADTGMTDQVRQTVGDTRESHIPDVSQAQSGNGMSIVRTCKQRKPR
ncbi:uncharacterized protein BP5553_10493 [Venustampulla echinocandica]|uniref:Uncharacterized protein n=1 Tax=Venustampulla echinocandica TaxID=2656787 RepID=A0A370T9G5_9HELO|nr:uncharacterized protein BP5553_10493 [Venustampulla echinocandica]RDL30215.1 hypothetical protein BP5553_10493 [Venustampulla echinocandica]